MITRLFSIVAILAFSYTAQAQFSTVPGPIGGGGSPDIVFVQALLPSIVSVGQTISFQLVVQDANSTWTGASTVDVTFEYAPFSFHTVSLTVPPFTPMENTRVLTGFYQTPVWLSPGSSIYLASVEVDVNNTIAESNENNNMTIPSNPPVIVH